MDIPLRSSALTYDFERPVTESALAMFDPDLRLVFCRQRDCFQVMRRLKRARRFHVVGVGDVAYFEDILYWVTDWKAGLEGRDDPYPLIKRLWESDIERHPNLCQDLEERFRENLRRRRQKVREEYRHAHQDNRRLLMKAWEPFFNHPAFTR